MIKKIILGTVQLGMKYGINNTIGQITTSEANNILKFCSDNGIKTFDTAADYGASEKRIGDFIRGQKDFKIITKFSKVNNICWKDSLNKSLRNLGIQKVDTIMFHSFDAYFESKHLLQGMINEGQNSLFDKIGVSIYTNEELNILVNEKLINVVQCPFNMLDNQLKRGEQLDKLKNAGKIIHTRSVFLQGLFFMDSFPDKLLPLLSYYLKIKEIAYENQISLGHLALQYVLSKKYIDGVLIGVDSVKQLSNNIKWAKTPIPSSVLSEIDNINVTETNLLNPSKW